MFAGSQSLDNLFLTIKTRFNWIFQSIATSKVYLFVAKYFRKEFNLNEVASDNDDGKGDDDDDTNSKNVEVAEETGGGE